jgi:ABC-2 type transport system ATP-binding protein
MSAASAISNFGSSHELGGSDPAEFAIWTRDLRKKFGDKVAVRGLTLQVSRGEVFGFLGPNGAGKSTSLKMLLGLVRPTFGCGCVLGQPLGHRPTRRRIGFLPEHFRFYEWLTSEELLRAHGQLCGLDNKQLRTRIPALLEAVGLTAHTGKQLRAYSKGMLQRIGLAQALIHKPDLIFLDEPTSGLDPVGRRLVRDLIKTEQDRGATVFLNSHLLSEVEITCNRVAFIRSGQVIEIRVVREFEESNSHVIARVGPGIERVMFGLETWSSDVQLNGQQLRFRLKAPEYAPRVLKFLVDSDIDVYEYFLERATLEDRFMELLGIDTGL